MTISANNITDIGNLRLKLVKPDEITLAGDLNNFITHRSFTESDSRFASAGQAITNVVIVNNQWFQSVSLTTTSNSLSTLNASDIQSFEDKIFAMSPTFKNNANSKLRQKVKLTYEFAGHSYENGTTLVHAIQAKFNNYHETNQGVFSLFNGTNGLKITATFAVQTNDGLVEFNTLNGTPADASQLQGTIQSTIKTELDLGE